MHRYIHLCILTLAALSVCSGAAYAGDTQVYKTVDAQGNVVYTDRPSVTNAKKTAVSVHEPSADDLAHLQQRRQEAEAAGIQRLQQTLTDKNNQAVEQKKQSDKQARCTNARNHFYSLKEATRIYQHDAQGNREYLSDEQAEAKRTEARKEMEAACAP